MMQQGKPQIGADVRNGFAFRYGLDLSSQAAGSGDRLTNMVGRVIQELLEIVTLYDEQGNELRPRQFAFVNLGARTPIWPAHDAFREALRKGGVQDGEDPAEDR